MDWLSDAARLLSADVWEDLDQLLADVRLLVVLHRLQVQHSETVLRPRAGPQHSVPYLSTDRLEVKTMEMKTPDS